MPYALSSLQRISTIVRFMTETVARGIALRATATLAPDLAGAWAERLFLKPPRAPFAQSALFALRGARSSFVMHRGRNLATWSWGPQDAPAVLLAHGWGGRAAQMRAFVSPLLRAGFRVIAFDQPAHGASEGQLTGLPDFADALAAVAAHHGGVRHVVAHSLGAVATAVAIARGQFPAARGLRLERAVLLSPPSDLAGYSRRFAHWYWMPEPVRRAMQAAIEERFGVRLVDLEIACLAPSLKGQALVIHDRNDAFVPWKQGAALARAWPGARLLTTEGLGHGRILESETALRAATDFLSGKSKIAGIAAPELPHPAPLY